MPELGLADKLLRLHETLDAAGLPHAFGGALALAYYAEPRVTVDIDVNVFVSPSRYGEVLALIKPLGVTKAPSESTVERDGQGRVWWGETPVDLFFSNVAIHDAMRERVRVVPFGADHIPVLAPEHLLVAKVAFNRSKDWIDIEQMLLAVPTLDLVEAHRWLDDLLAGDDPRLTRLQSLVAEVRGT